jgi:polyisoprenoid-binding protein YceI
MIVRNIGAALLALGLATAAQATTWTIDKDHSAVEFSIRHIVSKSKGKFDDVSGKITMDEKNLTSGQVEATIKTTSVNTANQKRDDHLRSADFFDTAKFPEMSFKSKKIVKAGDKYKIVGLLKIKGVEKEVTLDTTFSGISKDPWGNTRAGFSGTTKVNRKDFGIAWNKPIEEAASAKAKSAAENLLLGDEVTINLEIEAIQDKAPATK